ncbi:MAG: M48 family metallopeptidase [Dehalococcoidia bacterium]|nr:M48 family metallopeptidase [Dehalococcoidia bacterium]
MWEQIRYNQTRSAILVVGIGAVWLLLGFVFGLLASYITHIDRFESGIYGVIVASVLWVFITLVAYFYGDSIILAMSGARRISTGDLHRLYNMVEEMKIASGLEIMPSTYIIDDPALNAFAIGRDPNKAAIIVTTGLLTKLNRDELQGVIGHELAHIKNRDVLLMSLCTTLLGTMNILTWIFSPNRLFLFIQGLLLISPGLVFVILYILLIALTGWGITINMWSLITIFLAIPAFMLLMPFMAKLIYFAISRRREYLADASSALYTRYPVGLASALEKIAASTDQVLAASPVTAPIYIVNPFRKQGMAASDITSTHPPISQRIRILRGMAGASYQDYSTAYQQVLHTDKAFIPAAEAAAVGSIALRAAQPEPTQKLEEVQRVRETTNALWNSHNYRTITCACGTRMRLPPRFKLPEIKCPHCGRVNQV